MIKRLTSLAVAATILYAGAAAAQPVKIVVPFAAGGPVDQLARILAQELGPRLQADVIVENRAGAGGAIANEMVAKAAPDGRTILLGSLGSHVISAALKPPKNYDQLKSFTPVMLIGSVPTLLVVNPNLGVSSLSELVAKAKQGTKLSYGSSGAGTTMNIALEMLNSAAGMKVSHVPYRGGGPAINDLLGGHIDMVNADFPLLLPLVESGRVKALAQYATARSPLLKDVPTTGELGYPDVLMESWYAVFLPAGASAETHKALEQALKAIVETPSVAAKLAASGMQNPVGSEAFAARLPKEMDYWRQTIDKLGITAE